MNTAIFTQSLVVLFFCILPVAFSINCFQCNSEGDPECHNLKANQTNSIHYKVCNESTGGKEMFCRKIRLSLIDKDREHTRIIRSCGWEQFRNKESGEPFCKKRDTDFKMETICQCFTDGCNSAPVLSTNTVYLFQLPLLVLFLSNLYYRSF